MTMMLGRACASACGTKCHSVPLPAGCARCVNTKNNTNHVRFFFIAQIPPKHWERARLKRAPSVFHASSFQHPASGSYFIFLPLVGDSPSAVRPDGQLIASGVSELKPSPTGKTEYLLDNQPAEGLHLLVLGLQIARINDHPRGVTRLGLSREAAPDRSGFERCVIGTVVREPPVKNPGVEFLDELKIRRPKFDVLDSVITLGIVHRQT